MHVLLKISKVLDCALGLNRSIPLHEERFLIDTNTKGIYVQQFVWGWIFLQATFEEFCDTKTIFVWVLKKVV